MKKIMSTKSNKFSDIAQLYKWSYFYDLKNGSFKSVNNDDDIIQKLINPQVKLKPKRSSLNLVEYLSQILIVNVGLKKKQIIEQQRLDFIQLFTHMNCKLLALRLMNDYLHIDDDDNNSAQPILYFDPPKKFADVMRQLYECSEKKMLFGNMLSIVTRKLNTRREQVELPTIYKPRIIHSSLKSYLQSIKRRGVPTPLWPLRNLYLTKFNIIEDTKVLEDEYNQMNGKEFYYNGNGSSRFKFDRDNGSKVIRTRLYYGRCNIFKNTWKIKPISKRTDIHAYQNEMGNYKEYKQEYKCNYENENEEDFLYSCIAIDPDNISRRNDEEIEIQDTLKSVSFTFDATDFPPLTSSN